MTTEIQQENNVSECLPKKDRKAYHKAWREANKEKIRETDKAYREVNKEKIRKVKKNWSETNKETILEKKRTYYEINKNKILESRKAYYETSKDTKLKYQKIYREANKDKFREWKKINKAKRLKEDPLFAAKIKLRDCVRQSFRRIAQNKPTDTQTLLGCDWQTARNHFERLFKEGMTWENHGQWHIDHIRPVSSFAENELHLMNHISNLQPLWAEDNLSKRATIPPTPSV